MPVTQIRPCNYISEYRFNIFRTFNIIYPVKGGAFAKADSGGRGVDGVASGTENLGLNWYPKRKCH